MAASEKVVMLRQKSDGVVVGRVEPVRSTPPKQERLVCECGCDHFFVTRVDFTCTRCYRSYRD